MEIYLILLLVVVLFFQYGGKIREGLIVAIKSDPAGVIKYFGSVAVLSLTLSYLPSLMLLVYMRRNGFFSFEIFGDNQNAIQVLSLYVFSGFLLLAVYLFSPVLVWGTKADRVMKVISGVITLVMVGVIAVQIWRTGQYEVYLSIGVLGLSFVLYLYFWLSRDFTAKAHRWWVPLVYAAFLFFTPIFCNLRAAELTRIALLYMKVGGGMQVDLAEPLGFGQANGGARITGLLLLRTPEFYYLRLLDNPDHIVIVSTEHVSLRYLNKVGE